MRTASIVRLMIVVVALGPMGGAVMPAAADPLTVHINIKPGSDPNSVKASAMGKIPVVIHGSPEFDVTSIDQRSLELALSPNLARSSDLDPRCDVVPSRVATGGTSGELLCHVEDVGSYNPSAFDSLGEADGYPDLVCQFTAGLTLILGGVQKAYLSGYTRDGTLIGATDLVAEPTVLQGTLVCCVVCTGEERDNKSCGGCSQGDVLTCTDELKECDTQEEGNDWSGCSRPRVS